MKIGTAILQWALLTGLISACAGCTSRITPIGSGADFSPDEREKRLWEVSADITASLRVPGIIYDDPELESYIQGLVERLLGREPSRYRPLRVRVFIIDSPIPNAFALPDGTIFVHSGVLGRMRDEAQLALLLGHELTHATHRHAYQALENAYAGTGTLSYLSVLSSLGGGHIQRLVSGTAAFVTQAAISGYSRRQEREADRVGLLLAASAGYDPRAAAGLWEQMLETAEPRNREASFLYATHPKMKERVEDSRKLIEQLSPDLLLNAKDTGREHYVAATQSLILREVRTHIALGKFDPAARTLAFLTETVPKDARPLGILGDLYRARAAEGDLKRAISSYHAALELDCDLPEAHRGLGYAYMQEASKPKAVRCLQRYLELTPQAEDAEYVRTCIQRLTEEP